MNKIKTAEIAQPFIIAILALFIIGAILIGVPYFIAMCVSLVAIWVAASILAYIWNILVALIG